MSSKAREVPGSCTCAETRIQGWADRFSRTTLEINEAHPEEENKSYSFRVCWSEGSQPPSPAHGRLKGRLWGGKGLVWEREGHGLGKLEAGWVEMRHFIWLDWGTYVALSSGFWKGSREKIRKAARHWPSTHLSGSLLQKLVFGFLRWLPKRLWLRVLLSYVVWPLSICIQGLSRSPTIVNIMRTVYATTV